MIPRTSMRKALADPSLLGDVLVGASWRPWRTLLIAAMGEELTDDERVLFKQLTGGRECEPGKLIEEFIGVIGRRGGKSHAIAALGTYIAGLCEHPSLVRGERGICLIIAQDQKTADIVLDRITANFEGSPILRQLIEARNARELRLGNGITIEVRAADFRNLRGPTYICVIADEVAFWFNEGSSNPDDEILNAVRPGLATTRGPLFIISSPYARRGVLWEAYRKHFGKSGDPLILVVQGTSREFNPTLPQSVVDRALERDPVANRAEYLAEFRTDLEAFVSIEVVNACVSKGVYERPPEPGTIHHGFVDPSGGSRDAMTLCVGHYHYGSKKVIIDCLREVTPPLSPEAAVADFARTLKNYRVHRVSGDHYAGIWPVELFGRHNVVYEQNAAPKSDLYRDFLPLLNSKRVDLLDHPKCVSQLIGLERRTARGGRDSIDHAPGAHDDLANAVAGLAAINSKFGNYDVSFSGFQPDATATPANRTSSSHVIGELRSAIAGGYGWGAPSGRRWI